MRRWPNVANGLIGRGRNVDVEPTLGQRRLNVSPTLAQGQFNVAHDWLNVGPLNVGPTLVERHICDTGPTLAHR